MRLLSSVVLWRETRTVSNAKVGCLELWISVSNGLCGQFARCSPRAKTQIHKRLLFSLQVWVYADRIVAYICSEVVDHTGSSQYDVASKGLRAAIFSCYALCQAHQRIPQLGSFISPHVICVRLIPNQVSWRDSMSPFPYHTDTGVQSRKTMYSGAREWSSTFSGMSLCSKMGMMIIRHHSFNPYTKAVDLLAT